MFRKELKRRKRFKLTTKISVARMFSSIALASVDTIWALYMNSFNISESTIGFISAFLVALTFIFSIKSTSILEKMNEYKLLLMSLSALVISYLLVSLYKNLYFFVGVFVIVYIANIYRTNTFDIIFRDKSKDSELSANEGLLYSIINIGWLTGPLIAGYVMAYFNLETVFVTSALFMAVCLFFLLTMDIRLPRKYFKGEDFKVMENLKEFVKRKDFLHNYVIAMGVDIWWALIYIYMPLFIVKSGVNSEIVGFFLAAVIFPLVFFEFEVGKLVSKYGFRRFFVLGFFILGAFALLSFFTMDIYLIMVYLVLASFSMAFIEPLVDAYFFEGIKKEEEEKYYPLFGTYENAGDITGKFLIALVLLFTPNNFAYLTIAIIMFVLGLLSFRVKNRASEKLA